MVGIKGMEMPSSCISCDIRSGSFCYAKNKPPYNIKGNILTKDNDCPLVEIEERKQGKWIIDDEEHGRIWHCHCSNCKKDPQDYIGGSENWWLVRLPDYCLNCGSKNER